MNNTPSISMHIPLSLVFPNPEQPRTIFDQDKLQELADSIKEHGVIEPILVEQTDHGYMLHAGERRTLASRLAGLTEIPAVVQPPLNGTGPQTRLERALIENVQRADMTALEEARAYQRLRDEFKLTLPEISKRIGRNKTHIRNRLLLVDLEPEIQDWIEQGLLPHDSNAVTALLTLPAGATRIKFCKALAQRQPSIKVVISSCKRLLEQMPREKPSGDAKTGKGFTSPAAEIATGRFPIKRPEWDALHQLGMLPQWSTVREAATATCDACALRSIASEANCRDCPAVDILRKMIQASHAKPKRL